MIFNKLYIEFSSGYIKFIYANKKSNKIAIKKFGSYNMPVGAFENTRLVDSNILIDFIKKLKKQHRIGSCNASIIINDSNFISRPVQIPIINEKDLEKHIELEANQYLPINKENFEVGFKIIDKIEDNGNSYSKIMLSAGPRDNILNLIQCLDACKISVNIVDVYPNSISRLFSAFNRKDIAIIDMACSCVNITILEKGKFYMHSFIPTGIKKLVDSLYDNKLMDYEKFHNQYLYNKYEPTEFNNSSIKVDERISDIFSSTFGQLSRYLDFYNSRHFGKTVDSIHIIGEYALIKGLKSYMSERFNTKVEIGMNSLPITRVDQSFYNNQLSYSSLIGLALRGK